MKKYLQLFLLVLLSLNSFITFAQNLDDYNFSTGIDDSKWIPLTTGTSLISPGLGTDAGVSALQNIGFPFNFAGNTYTNFSVNTDGNISLGCMTGTMGFANPFNTDNILVNSPKINFLGCDGYMLSSGHIYYEVQGAAPNRVGVVEFSLSTYNILSRPAALIWQVQFYESTGNIQVVFGPTPDMMPNVSRQVGMATGPNDLILVDKNHIATHYTSGQSSVIPLCMWPEPNRYYLFSPSTTCLKPKNFTVDSVSIHDVSLSWSSQGTVTSWDVYVTDQTVFPDNLTVPTMSVTDTFCTISNLSAITTYYAYVRSNCSDDYGGWNNLSFSTLCAPIDNLPFYENFDSYVGTTVTAQSTNNLPICWNYINNGTGADYSGYPIIHNTTTNAHSGYNALRFFTYKTAGTYDSQYAILPEIDTSMYTMSNLLLEFDTRQNVATSPFKIIVGVLSNPADRSTFVPVDTLVIQTNSTNYVTRSVEFSNYTGNGSFIAFMVPRPSSGYNYGYIDDIVLSEISTCIKPTDVTINSFTDNSVEVDWQPGDAETDWQVVVVPHDDDVATGTVENTNTHPYTVYNLLPDTQYDVYVRSDCRTDASIWTNRLTFSTAPLCSSPRDLSISQIAGSSALVSWSPALYGALDYSVEYTEAGQNNWLLKISSDTSCYINGLLPLTSYEVRVFSNCAQESADTVSTTFESRCFVGGDVQIGEETAVSTYNSYFPTFSMFKNTYCQQIFLASEMNGPATITSVSFEMSTIFHQRNYRIYLMHTPLSTSMEWIPADSAQLCFDGNHNYVLGWNRFDFTMPFQYNGTDNLVLIVIDENQDYGSGNATYTHVAQTGASHLWYGDAVQYSTTTAPGGVSYNVTGYRNNVIFGTECDTTSFCVAPNVRVVESTDQSVTIDWAPGNTESSWILEYSTDNVNWTSEGTVTASPYTIYNLVPGSTYAIRMQSDCGLDGSSNWTIVSAETSCLPITIPYFENFESAYGSGSGDMLPCWTRNTNHATIGYPYTSTNYHHSGHYSVYFHGSNAYYSYLATPRLDDAVQMDNLLISFYAFKTSSGNNIEVGIMSDPEDYSTFVRIGSAVTPSHTSSWELIEVNTSSYVGNGRYLAFRTPSGTASEVHVDDITIETIPTCPHVTNIHTSSATLTPTSATLFWTAGGTETEWAVVYGLAGSNINPDNETPQQVLGSPSINLTGLAPETQYDVFVRAVCSSSDSSRWWSYSFKTRCAETLSLPYSNDFDSYNVASYDYYYPECWYRLNTYVLDRPCVNTTSYSAPNSLYFYTSTAGTYNMAILPPVDVSVPVSSLRATFMYRANSAADRLLVGVMTDPADVSTFVTVSTVVPTSSATTWTEKTVNFSTYTGTGRYIAFKNEYSQTFAYGYIDNLQIDFIPACPMPTHITANNVTTTSADLSWSDMPGEGSWEILVVPSSTDEPDFTGIISVSNNSFSVNSLMPDENYTVYLRTLCSNGEGYSNWATYNFSTAQIPAQTPYFCDFSDNDENTNWSFQNGNAVNKWHIGTPSGYSDNVLYVSNTGTSAAYAHNSPSVSWAYRDIAFDANSTAYDLSFNWKANGESTYDYLHVYIGDVAYVEANNTGTLNIPQGLVQLDEVRLNQHNTWQHFSTSLNGSYVGQTKRLYFVWLNDAAAGSNPAAVIDSIQIVGKFCGAPYDAHVTSLNSNSVDIDFASNSSISAWQYVVMTSPTDNPDDGTPVSIQNPNISLYSLTPNMTYYVYIRSDCGFEYSSWTDAVVFTAPCVAVESLPFVENFDSYVGANTTTAAITNLPSCWNYYNNGTSQSYSGYPIIYEGGSNNAYSGNNALRFYTNTTNGYDDQIAVLPQISSALFPTNTLQMTLQARRISSLEEAFLIVGVMTNPADRNSFVPVDTIEPYESLYKEFTVYFNNYSGSAGFIALMAPKLSTGYNQIYVDDIVVEQIPSCPKPVDLIASQTTETSITLSWMEVGMATTWMIEYGPTGFAPGTGTLITATSPSYTIDGLTTNTAYDFYVRSDCGNGEESQQTVLMARTSCGVYSPIPYFEDFNTYSTMTSTNTPPITYPLEDELPGCWSFLNRSYSRTTYPMAFLTAYSPSVVSGKCLMLKSSNTTPLYAVLPAFVEDIQDLQISFKYKNEGTSSSNGTLSIGYMTNPMDANTFVSLQEYPKTAAMTEVIHAFSSVPDTVSSANIAFKYMGGTNNYYVCIDDIVVDYIPDCQKPTDLAVSSVATDTATVFWNPGGFETAWIFQYKQTAAPDWSSEIPVSTMSYTLHNLTPNTSYQVRVQAVCDTSNTSEWTTAVTFTTAEEEVLDTCDAPSNLTVSDIHNHDVTLSWTENGSATSWTIYYRVHGNEAAAWNQQTVTTNPYTLTNLEGNTEYDYQVVANCADGETSEPSDIVTERTTNVGVEDYEASNIDVYPNPTTGMVQVSSSKFQVSGVDVYDVYGKLLNTLSACGNEVEVNLGDYAAGVYFLHISSEDGVVTKRIVKK
ncbi:MAG: fibronectin type III domain-containing protein [Bacteroidales bacterium]|nr:fibronectin type III domain-containing protein [Bacteroidales bacterium]